MSAHSSPAGARPSTLPGRSLVAGLVLLGLAAAVTGIAYQRMQTRRCLGFYGPDVARLVTSAPRVELLTLGPGAVAGRLEARSVRDISAARGLVHLRRGLVEDANFSWAEPQARGRLADEAWDVALVFSDPASPRSPVALVVDFDEGGGSLAVVGRPGRIGLGRIARGLATWLTGL